MNKLNKYLLAALVAQVAILLGMRLSSDDEPRMKRIEVFEGLDPDAVTRIEIWGATGDDDEEGPPQNHVTLAKKDGQWGVADADHFPVQKKKVTDLLEELEGLTSRTVVVDSPQYHAKLEVTDDEYQRKVTLTQGGEEITFYMGTSPSFKNTHIRRADADRVLLVNDFGASSVGDRAWNWVDRKYLDIPEDQVWSVKLQNGKGTLQLDKDPGSGAWAALGVAEALKTSEVTNLVKKARTLNMEAPVSKTVKPEHGLEPPGATVTLITGTSTVAGAPPPQTETVTLKVGSKVKGESRYYVKASTSEYVVEAAKWAVEPLLQKTKADLIEEEDDGED